MKRYIHKTTKITGTIKLTKKGDIFLLGEFGEGEFEANESDLLYLPKRIEFSENYFTVLQIDDIAMVVSGKITGVSSHGKWYQFRPNGSTWAYSIPEKKVYSNFDEAYLELMRG